MPSGISGSDVLQFFNAPSDDPYNNIENLAHYGDSLGAGPCRMSAHQAEREVRKAPRSADKHLHVLGSIIKGSGDKGS